MLLYHCLCDAGSDFLESMVGSVIVVILVQKNILENDMTEMLYMCVTISQIVSIVSYVADFQLPLTWWLGLRTRLD